MEGNFSASNNNHISKQNMAQIAIKQTESNSNYNNSGSNNNNNINNAMHAHNNIDLASLQQAVAANHAKELPPSQRPILERVPEVMDDFIRNFLVKHHMMATLAEFEQEWYARFGPFVESAIPAVPDNYKESMALLNRIEELEQSLRQHAELMSTMSSELATAQRERDFHRGSHNRVVQEKQRLTKMLKEMQAHVDQIEPTLSELRKKNESLFKNKSLLTIERDRLAGRVNELEEQLEKTNMQDNEERSYNNNNNNNNKKTSTSKNTKEIVAKNLKTSKTFKNSLPPIKENADTDTFVWPADDRATPSINNVIDTNSNDNNNIMSKEDVQQEHDEERHVIEQDPCEWVNRSTFTAHSLAVTKISLHPHKPAVASCSDDGSWRLHALPTGNRIAGCSKAHANWIADVQFSHCGTMLATASGDSTIKLWSFANNNCLHVFRGHTDGIWSVTFQDTDKLLATGSLDATARVWDVEYGKCRQTLRGHAEAVNVVQWIDESNLLCTGSADKTISLWDARMNTCVSTLYGHPSAILSLCVPHCRNNNNNINNNNNTNINTKSSVLRDSHNYWPRSETIVSSDAQGVVMMWDVRRVSATHKLICGKESCNYVHVNATNSHLAISCDDSSIKMVHLSRLLNGCTTTQNGTSATAPITVNLDQDYSNSCNNTDSNDTKRSDKSLSVVKSLRGHVGPVQCALFDQASHSFLVSCGSDGTIRYWCEE